MCRKGARCGTVRQCIVHLRGAKSAASATDEDALLILVFLFPPPCRFKNNRADGKLGNRLRLLSDYFCPLPCTKPHLQRLVLYVCTHTRADIQYIHTYIPANTHSTSVLPLRCSASASMQSLADSSVTRRPRLIALRGFHLAKPHLVIIPLTRRLIKASRHPASRAPHNSDDTTVWSGVCGEPEKARLAPVLFLIALLANGRRQQHNTPQSVPESHLAAREPIPCQ